ncbi:conserved hypothetical protein [Histoplasma capsulatum H143]|uniref:UBL3-like ubiquitin domain-containing protein n=1 Tax=Ajellomyces capsulatus (strain H143) TaxID=544712 RepID=C6HMD7_AJECH|nr:conserved hypothetical protein [Histoplasma capsulatum H143]
MASSAGTPIPIHDSNSQSQQEDAEKIESPLALPISDAPSTQRDSPDSTAMTATNAPSPAPVRHNDDDINKGSSNSNNNNNDDDTTDATATSSSDPAVTDSSHPPATIESAEPSEPPGTSTTIRENTPPSPTSQPHDATASQSAPTTTTNTEPPPQQIQSATQPTSETEETKQCSPAVGPSSELPGATGKELEDPGMVLNIDLLLITGARHPFKIDAKYLRKRQVDVPDFNPYAMSVYTLKELIWREWRSDLRLTHNAPNVIHMTIKPQEVVDEEDAKATRSTSGRERDGGDYSPRCRCVIL